MTHLVNAMIRTGLQMCEDSIAPIGLKPHMPKRKLHRYRVSVKNITVTYTAACKSSVIMKLFREYGFPLRMNIGALKSHFFDCWSMASSAFRSTRLTSWGNGFPAPCATDATNNPKTNRHIPRCLGMLFSWPR
jgi:hypothetical protein